MRIRIRLDTMTDVNKFISVTSNISRDVKLEDNDGHCVSAKSLLGALASMEWDTLYCYCDEDISSKISEFVLW